MIKSINATPATELTSGRLIAKSTFYNLLGQGIPVVVAMFSIPLLTKGLGVDRFGLLNLVWLLIGYFSLFDLGISRALTHLVAGKLGSETTGSESDAVTGLVLMSLFGIAGGAVMAIANPWIVTSLLKIPSYLQGESRTSLYYMACAIPIIIATTGMRGILEAHQQFAVLNAIRIPMGIYNFVAPLLILPFSLSLTSIVAVLLVGRFIAFFLHLKLCVKVMPRLREARFDWARMRPLLRFGSWMTVTNIALPIISSLDRLFIAALVSVAAVAYYTTPQEVVGRAGSISAALAGVLFPAFATTMAKRPERAALLFWKGLKYTFVVMFPILLCATSFAREGLTIWLGADFAAHSTRAFQWQAIAVFLSCFVQIPFAFIQGTGRPEWSAKLQLIELCLYVPVLFSLVICCGIIGAAVAWILRIVFELIALLWILQRYSNVPVADIKPPSLSLAAACIALVLAPTIMSFRTRVLVVIVGLVVFTCFGWFQILDADDRSFSRTLLRGFAPGSD